MNSTKSFHQLTASLLLGGALAFSVQAGPLLDLYYYGTGGTIPGTAVTNLTSDPTYPDSPGYYDVLSDGLASPLNVGDNYGRLIRGYIEAPQTGHYIFWIASDDASELWLSSNEDAGGKVKIAAVVGYVGPHNYYADAAQKSAPVSLVKGRKYYFEVLHKEGGGGDFVMVQWQLPDGTTEDPIAAKHLWPFPVDTSNPQAYSATPLSEAPVILNDYLGSPVDTLASTTVADDGAPVDLTIATDGTQPVSVQWYSNGVAIPDANLLSYHLPRATTDLDGAVYSVSVSNSLGGPVTASTTLSVTADTIAPTLVDALNLGNPAGDVAVVFSKSVDPTTAAVAGNYGINGGARIANAHMGPNPDTVLLQVTGLTAGTSYTITVSNVQDLATTPNVISPGSSIPVEADLNAWYRLDESSGTVANDSSGHGRNGTMVADVIPGYAGKVFRALRFINSLTPGYVKLPSGFSDFTTNGLTLSLWADPTSEGGAANWDRFVEFGNGPANNNILFSRNGAGQSVNFSVYNGGSGAGVSTPDGTLFMNQWQHFTATMDVAGTVTLYRNGVEVASGTVTPPPVVTRTNDYLGLSNWAGDDHYDGRMDDVRVYNRVLDPAAIRALAAGGGPDDMDPAVPNVSITATTPSTALHNTPPGVFTVTRIGATNADVTVQYAVSGAGTNGSNYASLSGSVVIPAGTNAAQVLVSPIDFSFGDLSRTVILTLTPNAAYSVGAPDSAIVTIQNNDVSPAAIEATADNPVGSVSATTVDVWFAAPVTDPSASTVANYTLVNAPGLSVTNATLGNGGVRVVLGISGPVPADAMLSVSGVQDAGGNSAPSEIPIYLRQAPVNLVSDSYHSPNGRAACFPLATDGVVDNVNNGGGFDTYNGGGQPSEFVGLLYPFSEEFHVLRVDLGNQFSDGGSWASQPKVYILKNPVDSNQTRPETDTNDWVQVPAKLISASQFHTTVEASPSPSTPIAFDLSDVPASDRTGYGWAVGGVPGNGGKDFISVSEVSGYGVQGTNNTLVIVQQPTNLTVTAGQIATFTEQATDSIVALSYQWQRSDDGGTTFNNIPGANDANYSLRPAMPSDNNAQFKVIISTAPPVDSLASQVATLTVLDRTTPPVVLDAAYDPTNLTIDVWFDEAVDSGSASTMGNYQINDPGLTLNYVAGVDAQSRRAVLSVTGAPSGANPTVTVNNVQDLFGNTISSAQTVPLLSLNGPAARVVANQYQQGRNAAFTRSTDGQVNYDANVTTWTTFGGPAGQTDFAGVTYAQPQIFGVVKVDLGYQFGDGGDWGFQPKVFILKSPVDSNQTPPESDPADWMEVPATPISGNIFTSVAADAPADTVPPPNTPIAFDLSQLPLDQRAGYGWAVGGVRGNGPNAQFVSIAELRSFGTPASSLTNVTGAPKIVLDVAPLDQTLPGGFPLDYNVVATGSEPLHYQWYFNHTALGDTARITGTHSATLSFANTQSSDSGGYSVVVTNSMGSVTSSVANLTLTGIAFNNGGGWARNGNAAIAANSLTLTSGGTGLDSSSFLNYPVDISTFTATWTYQDIGGGGADGTVFAMQNDPRGPLALGGGGSGLGYSGIVPSVGFEFNVYGPNAPGIALHNDGTTGGPYSPSTPVDVSSGDPIDVVLQYDGTTLHATLTDTVTSASFMTNWDMDVPAAVGETNMAYVGFTGASGGVASHQIVSNFTFTSGSAVSVSLSLELTAPDSLRLSWPVTAATYVLQETSGLSPANWATVTNGVQQIGGQNQVTVSPGATARFYRLQKQ